MIPKAYITKTIGAAIGIAALAMSAPLAGCLPTGDDGSDVEVDGGNSSDAADADTESVPSSWLVSPNSWAVIEASEDPVEDAPDTVICDPENGTKIEQLNGEAAFGVSTRACEYVAVRQATLNPVSAGDTVFVRAWHFELTAPEEAEAHLAVALDGETIWEERIPIPSGEGGLLTHEWTAPRDIPVGTEIVFHAHNHGNNEYYLIEVSRQ
ncbi:MAG: hypothetical protein ACQEVA_21720 [Myxococcota bacterium]